jgi:hypothetical protein
MQQERLKRRSFSANHSGSPDRLSGRVVNAENAKRTGRHGGWATGSIAGTREPLLPG